MARRPPAHGVILVNEAGDEYSLAGTGTSSQTVQGAGTFGAAVVGAPVYVGSRVDVTANGPTAEADGDLVPFWLTATGAQVIGGVSQAASAAGLAWANQALVSLPSGAFGPLGVITYVSNGTSTQMACKPNATSRIPSAAASTNATSAKATAGDLHCISYNNASGAVRYLKFYNKATAPTVGTDVPVITLALPAGADTIPMGGHYFSTGIAYALTTGAADADTGALTAADILGLTITYA